MPDPKKPFDLRESLLQLRNNPEQAEKETGLVKSSGVFEMMSGSNVANASVSQMEKANLGPAGDRLGTLLAKSDEELAIEKFRAEILKEKLSRIPIKGSLEETHKEFLKDDKKFEKFQDEQKRLADLKKADDVSLTMPTTGGMGAISAYGVFTWLKDFFTDEGKERKKEIKYLNQKTQKDLTTTVRVHQDKLKRALTENQTIVNRLNEEKAKLQIEAETEKQQSNLGIGGLFFGEEFKGVATSKIKKINEDLHNLDLAKKYQDETIKQMDHFLAGDMSTWDALYAGASNSKRNLKTAGVHDLISYHGVAKVAQKLDNLIEKNEGNSTEAWNQLSVGEQSLMKAFTAKNDLEGQDLMRDRFVYHTAAGTAQSLVFMEGMLLSEGVGGIAEGVASGLTRSLAKKIIEGTVKNSIKRRLGLVLAKNLIPQTARVAAAGVGSVSTYSNMARKYIGDTEIVKDENGNEKVLVRKGLYDNFMRDYEYKKNILEDQYNDLWVKSNKTEEDFAELESIKEDIEALDADKDRLATAKDLSWGKALAYGYTESMKEYASERFVGELGGAATSRLAKSKLGRAFTTSKLGMKTKALGEMHDGVVNAFNNTMVGKLSGKLAHHTGAGQVYHGLPGEMLEEIAVQATPTLTENYMDQLRELKNPAFYADVVAQTLLMSGGMASLGLGSQVINYQKNKKFYDSRKAIRNSYRALDKAVTDEDVINTISMSVGGTNHSLADYNAKIQKLRKEGKTDEANHLEQKKFYSMALRAMQTNTLEEFEKSLDRVIAHNNDSKSATSLSADVATNISIAKEQIATLKSTYEKYKGNSNIGTILDLASQKITNKKTIRQLEDRLLEVEPQALEEVKAAARIAGYTGSISSMEDLQLENFEKGSTERQNLAKFLNNLNVDTTPTFAQFIDLDLTKDMVETAHAYTMKDFNEQVSPTYKATQEKIADVNRQVQNTLDFIDKSNVADNVYKRDRFGRVVVNEALVNSIFKRIDTKGLDKRQLHKIKADLLNKASNASEMISAKAVDRINDLYKQKEKENQTAPVVQDNTEENTGEETEQAEEFTNVTSAEELEAEPVDPEYAAFLDQQHSEEYISAATEDSVALFDPRSNQTTTAQAVAESLTGVKEVIGNTKEDDAILPSSDIYDEIGNQDNDKVNTLDDYVLAPLQANFTSEQLKGLAGVVKKFRDILGNEIGREPSFTELMAHLINYAGKAETEQFFDSYKAGWLEAGFPQENFDAIYAKLFDPTREVMDELRNMLHEIHGTKAVEPVTESQVQEQAEAQKEEGVTPKTVSPATFTEENVPVFTKLEGENTLPLTAGFNAVPYRRVQLADGSFITRPFYTVEGLNEDSFVDYKDLLHPDKYNAGDKVSVAMAPQDSWEQIKVNTGEINAEGENITISYAESIKDKGPDFIGSKEFIDTVPMFMLNEQGKPVAYIHGVDWFNEWNTPDPNKPLNRTVTPGIRSKAQQERIEQHREEASALRHAIYNGKVNQITITEKVPGPFYNTSKKDMMYPEGVDEVPAMTINEANPQAIIAVQTTGNRIEIGDENGIPVEFENNKRKLVQNKSVETKGKAGYTWNLRRVGIDPVDGKETWMPCLTSARYATKEELESVRWAWAVHSFYAGGSNYRNMLPEKYRMDKEQVDALNDKIKKAIGLDMKRYKDFGEYAGLFFRPKGGTSVNEYGKTIFSSEAKGENFYGETSKKYLNKEGNIALINENGEIVDTGKNYQEYLKDKFKSPIKSFNVGTEEEPVYATSVQPTLLFSWSASEQNNNNKVETVEMQVQENKKNALASFNEILNIQDPQVLIEKAKGLVEELGFDYINSAMAMLPSTLQSVESLKSMFTLTPGLNLGQEDQLVSYMATYILSTLDVKYKASKNLKEIKEALQGSFTDIILPNQQRVQRLMEELVKSNEKFPTEDTRVAIRNLGRISSTLDKIKEHWDSETLRKRAAENNEQYEGQAGLVEKALEKVYQNSDIKEKANTNEDSSEEGEGNETDPSVVEKKYGDASALQESGKMKTTYRLRRFMSGITKIDENGNKMKGFLGLPQYMSYNEVYDSIYQLLGAGVHIESSYDLMKARILENKESHPWVQELVDKFDNADAQLRKELVYNYRKHAVSMKFVMYTPSSTGAGLQVYETNANEITRVIINGWKNNFKTSPLVATVNGSYDINREVAKQMLDEFNSWDKKIESVPDAEVRAWFSKFGLNFTDKYWEDIKGNGMKVGNKQLPYKSLFEGPTPGGILSKFLAKVVAAKKEDVFNFEEDVRKHPFKDMNNIIKSMARTETKYTNKILSKSFRDAGKNISGVTNPTHITDRVDNLKRAVLGGDTQLIDDLGSLSISSKSILLELLRTDPNFASKFEANYLGLTAIKKYGAKSSNFSSITQLNSLDHDLTKLGMFQDVQQGTVGVRIDGFDMRMAEMFLPTMSDKSQMITLHTGVFDFMTQSDIAFKKEDGQLKFSQDLRDLIFNRLILPEMTRISKFHTEVKSTNISDYDSAAQLFNFFPGLNNVKDENGDRIIEHLASQPLEKVVDAYKHALTDLVEEILHKEATEKMETWAAHNETSATGAIKKIKIFDEKYLETGTGTLNDKFEVGTYDFVLNSMFTNMDSFTMIAGDPAMFSKNKMYRVETEASKIARKEDASLKPEYKKVYQLEDSDYIENNMKQGVNIGKRLALLVAPGQTLADSMGQQYKQIFLKDTETITSNAEYLIKLYYGEENLDKELYPKTTVREALEQYATATNTRKAIIREALSKNFSTLSDYFNIESTDAQEYTTASEHINILFNQGRMSEDMYNTVQAKLKAGEDLKKEELHFVMQPIKPVYTGQVIDKDQDVARTVYIKSSSFPLLPQLTAGTKLDALRAKMEEIEAKEGQGVRASYQTANKVGSLNNPIDPLNANDLENIERSMLTLDRSNFRIQQDVPFKSDSKKEDKIAMGTQFFKILFGDGMLNQEGFALTPGGDTMNGKELYDFFNTNFKNLVNLKRQKLFKELGLDNNGNIINEEESLKKLQDLLQKEAISKDYPIQDINSLEIETLTDIHGNTYQEFKIPLWLSGNSNRFESLLNSIVTNRIMAHKLPGNSFVAGSENGFEFKEDMSDLDKSRVIYLDGFNGKELQGVHTTNEQGEIIFHKAQVLAPSKFKDANGKLIDLFKKDEEGKYIYLDTTLNGTLALRKGMIDPQLLTNFSFRTPTSAHVSGSVIEIVGILPPEVGDLMIVPKNFTKQKGLDFDVDKENCYQLNHVVNHKTGKIEELTEKHKNQRLKPIKEVFEDLDMNRIEGSKKQANLEKIAAMMGELSVDIIEEESGETFKDNLLKEIMDENKSIQDKLEYLRDKHNDLLNKYDLKIAENNFIKVHTAVFTNPHPEVQKKINKVLSMQFASEQADLIEGLTAEGELAKKVSELGDSSAELESVATEGLANGFTILSDEYQKHKMGLGSAGKLAIGVYSNYLTLHALSQQGTHTVRMTTFGEDKQMINKTVTIGDKVSDGVLGREMTLDGGRSVAEAFAEKQNTATDNEKEQILGRVNVNKNTISVDALLTLLGFDKLDYKDEEGNTKALSVSYGLLSQPIIREYVEAMNGVMGITSEFDPLAADKIVNGLLKKYDAEPSLTYVKGLGLRVQNKILNIQQTDIGSKLTGEALVEGIRTNGKNQEVQVAALAMFLDLDVYAKSLAKAQSLVDTNDLGKSIIESETLYNNLKEFPGNAQFSNLETLIGNFQKVDSEHMGAIPEGSYLIGNYIVTPTSPQGQIAVHGIATSNKLWAKYFPYSDPHINKVLTDIMVSSGVDMSNKTKVVEAKQEIMEEIKKYIFSWKSLGIFTQVATEERQRLFMDSKENTSLANYLNTNYKEVAIANNKLLSRFTYEIDVTGFKPSIIKFNNTISDDLEEKYLYNSLAELILEDRKLPDWNGKPFSTKQLAQELITYAYVEGGVQEAIQFIKYVPVEYLSEIGITTQDGQFVSAATALQRVSTARNPEIFRRLLGDKEFTKQFFQHHPDRATFKTFEDKDIIWGTESKTDFTLNSEQTPNFIVMATGSKSKVKHLKYALYEHMGQGGYRKINILGAHGMNEYEAGNRNVSSVLTGQPKANTAAQTPSVEISITPLREIQNGDTVESVLDMLANSSDPEYIRFREIAKVLKGMVKPGLTVEVGDMEAKVGVKANGVYLEGTKTIVINEKLDKVNSIRTFIHEYIHAVSLTELKKYFEADADGKYTVLKEGAPEYVVELDKAWKTFIGSVDPAIIASAKAKTKLLHEGKEVVFSDEERELGYAATDIFEFLSVAIESKTFQQQMSKIPYGDKTLWEHFRDAVLEILKAINPDIVSNSVAEAAIKTSLNFIQQEAKINEENRIFAEIDPKLLYDVSGIPDSEDAPSDNIESDKTNTPENSEESFMPGTVVADPFNQNC